MTSEQIDFPFNSEKETLTEKADEIKTKIEAFEKQQKEAGSRVHILSEEEMKQVDEKGINEQYHLQRIELSTLATIIEKVLDKADKDLSQITYFEYKILDLYLQGIRTIIENSSTNDQTKYSLRMSEMIVTYVKADLDNQFSPYIMSIIDKSKNTTE